MLRRYNIQILALMVYVCTGIEHINTINLHTQYIYIYIYIYIYSTTYSFHKRPLSAYPSGSSSPCSGLYTIGCMCNGSSPECSPVPEPIAAI